MPFDMIKRWYKKRSIIFNFRLIRIYNKKSLIFYHMQHGCAQILNVVENRKMCQKMVRNCQNCLLFSDICYCYCLKKEYKNGKVSSNIWPGEWVITKLGIADLTAQCLKYLKKSPFTTLRANRATFVFQSDIFLARKFKYFHLIHFIKWSFR